MNPLLASLTRALQTTVMSYPAKEGEPILIARFKDILAKDCTEKMGAYEPKGIEELATILQQVVVIDLGEKDREAVLRGVTEEHLRAAFTIYTLSCVKTFVERTNSGKTYSFSPSNN